MVSGLDMRFLGGKWQKINAMSKGRATADPSTPLFAKCATNFAQDDTVVVGLRKPTVVVGPRKPTVEGSIVSIMIDCRGRSLRLIGKLLLIVAVSPAVASFAQTSS